MSVEETGSSRDAIKGCFYCGIWRSHNGEEDRCFRGSYGNTQHNARNPESVALTRYMPTLRMDGSDPFERYAYDPAKEKDIMKRKTSLNAMATLWLLLFSVSFSAVSVAAAPTKPDKESILRAYGKIPLYFIENKGQLDPKVKFYVKTSGQTLYFTDEGVVFDFHRNKKKDARNGAKGGLKGHQNRGVKTERLVFNLGFENAREGIMIKGLDRQDAVINCFLGNDRSKWKSDIPTYSGVVYKGIYKRIDLKVFGNGKGIEYEFIVNPGGNPGDILLTYNGIEGLATSREGEMLIATAFGELKETRPYIYQEIKGKRAVDGRFAIQSPAGQSQTGKFSYGFQVASYNPSYPLIIDPTLSYSTYLGGSDSEEGYGIAVDGSGNAYVAGETSSTNFPTQNPYQGANAGDWDAFITKLSPTGNALSYSTYLGGSGFDRGNGIAVNGSGNAYITGRTYSINFPSRNPYQGAHAGGERDAFITKLSPTGNALSYSTYFGGSGDDFARGIAVDGSGNAYVTGATSSTNFPIQNAYQGTYAGGERDAFVAKLSDTMLTLAGPLSDTGQTKCYNRDSESGIPCPKPGEAFYGQDGNYLINSPSYTKLDAAGNDLLNTATKWTMVRDNLTRLIWEVKTDDGSIHDRDNQYEWQNAQDIFVAQVNIANFGGHSDWRLPTIQELSSITALGQDDPAVSETYFPNTVSSDYWSSTAGTTGGGDYDSDFAWIVYFKHGHGYNHPKYNYYYVRAVRGGQSGSLDHLVINSDGTVTDTNTGLMWQQSTTGIVNWQSALAECEGLTLGGYGDWRLPNRRELNSIVDYTLYNPAVSETYFPNTVAFYYWSSTTYTYYIYGAWQVHFKFGEDSWSYKSDGGYVRAVRGGQNWLLGSLTISTPSQGSMWKGGDIMPIRWNTSGISGNVKISISSQGGKDGTFHTIIDSTPNDGSYHWTVNVATSVNCMLRVEPVSDATKGTSQGLFSIETSGAPFVPKLQLAISGLQLSISWTNVVNANGYIFSYAPAPYNGLDTIRTIDMADKTSFSVELWDGAAFFVAVQAYNDAGISTYSNIEYVEIDLTNISVIPSNLNLSQGGTKTFDISGGTRPYSAPSMDTEVARFGTSGSILYVKGISTGSTTPSNGR